MKRAIIALLPLILAAQLPISAVKYVPAEWMKSFEYGLKWTELMMNGYPGASETADKVPEGEVTMTVTLASAIPEFHEIDIEMEKDFCRVHPEEEIQMKTMEVIKRHRELRRQRLIKIGTVNLIQL
jgi:hypothetical protein